MNYEKIVVYEYRIILFCQRKGYNDSNTLASLDIKLHLHHSLLSLESLITLKPRSAASFAFTEQSKNTAPCYVKYSPESYTQANELHHKQLASWTGMGVVSADENLKQTNCQLWEG